MAACPLEIEDDESAADYKPHETQSIHDVAVTTTGAPFTELMHTGVEGLHVQTAADVDEPQGMRVCTSVKDTTHPTFGEAHLQEPMASLCIVVSPLEIGDQQVAVVACDEDTNFTTSDCLPEDLDKLDTAVTTVSQAGMDVVKEDLLVVDQRPLNSDTATDDKHMPSRVDDVSLQVSSADPSSNWSRHSVRFGFRPQLVSEKPNRDKLQARCEVATDETSNLPTEHEVPSETNSLRRSWQRLLHDTFVASLPRSLLLTCLNPPQKRRHKQNPSQTRDSQTSNVPKQVRSTAKRRRMAPETGNLEDQSSSQQSEPPAPPGQDSL
jgi:hypothetical protein